jgi:DNA-binding response OmpR family regulator
MKVLAVEDNKELASSIRDYLSGEGYICEVAYNFDEAREKLMLFSYDSILLDIMLPDGNGLELLKLIRKEDIQSGVLIISAKNALDDKVNGLEGGADDYITKPFHLPELHARLRAIYRRKKLEGSNLVSFNEIALNTDTLEARINTTVIKVANGKAVWVPVTAGRSDADRTEIFGNVTLNDVLVKSASEELRDSYLAG